MLRRILKPGGIAAFTVLLITFYSWKPVFEAISQQKAMSAEYLLRHLAVYIIQAVVVYAFVYWRISSLMRDKSSPLSKIVHDNSKTESAGTMTGSRDNRL
jgi:hypothetical protein